MLRLCQSLPMVGSQRSAGYNSLPYDQSEIVNTDVFQQMMFFLEAGR